MQIGLIALSLLFPFMTLAQSTTFVSQIDKDLSIKNISVAPLADNVSSIYAAPLTDKLTETIKSDRQWDLIPYAKDAKYTPEQFEDNPNNVKSVLTKIKADALLSGRISKGPSGISIKLTLFSAADGLPIAQEASKEYPGFELSDLKIQVDAVYTKLKQKILYNGVVLSRKGNLVTMNMGSSFGLKPGSEITAVQIINVTRHPRFKFIVSSEKVILGTITLSKVDDSLSFGSIVAEKEASAIKVGTKLTANDFIVYPEIPMTGEGKLAPDLNDRKDSEYILGNKPKEWLPERAPTYGKVGLLFGLGSYAVNNSVVGGTSAGSNQLVPSVHLNGEMWLSSNWQLNLLLRQYVFSVGNGYPGTSSPDRINISSAETALSVAYNFLVGDDFFGPKIQVAGGMSNFNSTVDASTPLAFNSMKYSGMFIGIGGSFPLQNESNAPISLGGQFKYFLFPAASESPGSSASAQSTSIASFNMNFNYKISERFNYKTLLIFDQFRGSVASHTITTLAMGLEYMF